MADTLLKPAESRWKSRCQLCRSLTLASLAGVQPFMHHPSISALRTSATGKNACDLCLLIWNGWAMPPCPEEVLQRLVSEGEYQIQILANHPTMCTMPELNGHTAFDELIVSCGKENPNVLIDLYTSDSSRLSTYFRGRKIPPNPASLDTFSTVKTWLQKCSQHPECGPPADNILPKRVLDLGLANADSVSLKTTSGEETGCYVALSYCWGVSPGLVTTFENLEMHKEQISLINMPATLVDAVQITRELGFRYLWIDALCILQARGPGDHEAIADWQDQSSKMASVYGNAYLTISAANSRDKHDGCFSERPPDLDYCEIPLTDDLFSETVFARYRVRTNDNRDPIDSRAWTFQETVLSQRILLYRKTQIEYRCKNARQLESTEETLGGSLLSSQFSMTPKDNLLVTWYSNIQIDYSTRQLTNDNDILPAISGVARRFQEKIGGRYFAGVWANHILPGLLWQCGMMGGSDGKVWLERPEKYRAPSWSWAACKTRCNRRMLLKFSWNARMAKRWEKEKDALRTIVIKIDTTLVGPVFDPMGQVSDGYIIIKGPAKNAIVVSEGLDDFMRNHEADRPKHFARAICPRNTYLLVETVRDPFELSLVGALGYFDTEDDQPSSVICLSLSPWDYGIMLAPTEDRTHRFRRVGAFDLYQLDWMKTCDLKTVTII